MAALTLSGARVALAKHIANRDPVVKCRAVSSSARVAPSARIRVHDPAGHHQRHGQRLRPKPDRSPDKLAVKHAQRVHQLHSELDPLLCVEFALEAIRPSRMCRDRGSDFFGCALCRVIIDGGWRRFLIPPVQPASSTMIPVANQRAGGLVAQAALRASMAIARAIATRCCSHRKAVRECSCAFQARPAPAHLDGDIGFAPPR